MRVLQDTEFESDGRTIRCTEVNLCFDQVIRERQVLEPVDSPVNVRLSLQVFYQLKTPDCSRASVLSSCSIFQKEIALAACSALTPHLAVLTSSGINCVALRISTQADMVKKCHVCDTALRVPSFQLSWVWWLSFYVCVLFVFFTLRWSTRLAVEAGSSLSATWTNWTALWSPSSMEVAPVYHRLPWTWSLSFTSHTPSNTCKTATQFKPAELKVAQTEMLLFVSGHAKATPNFAQLDLRRLAQHSHSEVVMYLLSVKEALCWSVFRSPKLL